MTNSRVVVFGQTVQRSDVGVLCAFGFVLTLMAQAMAMSLADPSPPLSSAPSILVSIGLVVFVTFYEAQRRVPAAYVVGGSDVHA